MCSASRLDIVPTYCFFVAIWVTQLLDVISMYCRFFFLIFTTYFYFYVCECFACTIVPVEGQLYVVTDQGKDCLQLRQINSVPLFCSYCKNKGDTRVTICVQFLSQRNDQHISYPLRRYTNIKFLFSLFPRFSGSTPRSSLCRPLRRAAVF